MLQNHSVNAVNLIRKHRKKSIVKKIN